MEPTPSPQSVTLQAQWMINPGDVPSTFNQVLLQPGQGVSGSAAPDGCYITFGHAMPPVIPDGLTPEQLGDYSRVNVIPVVPVGRYFVSTDRLIELRNLINEFLEKTNDVQR